jgi:serine/threonine protein kinase
MTLPIGYHIVGRFEILKVIAQGGFGIAYWAYDKNFHREVCIKELFIPKSQRLADYSVQTASINGYDGSYFIKNFLSEARKVANVRHENIVEVRDVFEANGTAYIVMEYVKGISLSDKIKREGPLNPVTAVSLFRTLCDAVQKLHSISLIHRDIKPDNILVEAETGRIVLIDFGNAKEMHSGTDSFAYLSNGYSAIEQYSKEAKKTFATDIYSIGATMYFALTGNQPITAVDRISSDGLTPPNAFNPSIENFISNAILRAMSVQVENRYQNVVDFKNAISCPPTEIEPENTYVVTDNNPVYKENNQKKVIIGVSLALVFVAILVYLFMPNKNSILKADFEIPEHVEIGETITLKQLSKGEEIVYKWEIEGANIENSEEQSPQVMFNEAGEYRIKLTVKNTDGIETSVEKIIVVDQLNKIPEQEQGKVEKEGPIAENPEPEVGGEIEKEPVDKIITVNCKIKFDGKNKKNMLTWNSNLENADNLILTAKSVGGFYAQYNVTGTSYFVYNPQSAKADKYQTTFTLSTTDTKFSLSSNQLTESEVSCSANQ